MEGYGDVRTWMGTEGTQRDAEMGTRMGIWGHSQELMRSHGGIWGCEDMDGATKDHKGTQGWGHGDTDTART